MICRYCQKPLWWCGHQLRSQRGHGYPGFLLVVFVAVVVLASVGASGLVVTGAAALFGAGRPWLYGLVGGVVLTAAAPPSGAP